VTDVLPIAELTNHAQRFRCEALRCVLTARDCLARQGAVRLGGRNQTGVKTIPAHPTCQRCPTGEGPAVVAQLAGVVDDGARPQVVLPIQAPTPANANRRQRLATTPTIQETPVETTAPTPAPRDQADPPAKLCTECGKLPPAPVIDGAKRKTLPAERTWCHKCRKRALDLRRKVAASKAPKRPVGRPKRVGPVQPPHRRDDLDAAARATPKPVNIDRKAPAEDDIRAMCAEIADMLCAKNRAYGNSALEPVRVFSKVGFVEQIRVRLDDKLSRLARGDNAGEDVVLDLIGYLVLLRIAEKCAAHNHTSP
jgi:hypothetical protein